MKNVGRYGCLTKKNSQLKLSTVARNTFNIRRGRSCNFLPYIKELFKVNLGFRTFKLTEGSDLDSVFNFLLMKFNVLIISGDFRVNRKFIIKLQFHAIFVKR